MQLLYPNFIYFKSFITIFSILIFFTLHNSSAKNMFEITSEAYNIQDPVILGVNCGGGGFTYDDKIFIADKYFTGNGGSYVNNNISDIFNTTQDDLFYSERSTNQDLGSFGYEIPITNGTYIIKLHFAEIYFGATGGGPAGNGKRVFSVDAEDTNVLLEYDIYQEVGSMTAVTKTYSVTVTDEILNLDFSSSVNQPKLSAFEILGDGELIDPYAFCTWNDVADSSFEKVESQSARVNGKLYVLAGFLDNLKITGATEIYDPANNIWSSGTDMPDPVTHMGSAVIGNEIWIVGGFTGNHPGVATDKVQVYNTITDEWRQETPLPNPRGSGAAVYNDGKLHFFGGLLPDRLTDVGEHYILNISDQAAGWKPVTDMPNPRNHLSGASVFGKVYAIGGQYGHDGGTDDQNFLHMYDPDTDIWIEKANLPTDRSHFEPGTEVFDNKIIITGGRNQNIFFSDVTQYDPLMDAWTELCPLQEKLLAPVAKVFGTKLYISNGGNNGTCCPLDKAQWIELEDITLGINDIEPTSNYFNIYPNPASTFIKFDLKESQENINIEIYNISGQLIKSILDFDVTKQLSLIDMSKGLYIVKILLNNDMNSTLIRKMILQ